MSLMSLLTKRTINNPEVPLSASRIVEFLGLRKDDVTGVTVNQDTVFGRPEFYRAVRLVSESVAKLPLVVFRRLPEGGKERARSHPAYTLLAKQSNLITTAYEFIRTLTGQAILHGNGYAVILRDGSGRPIELIQVDARHVAVGVTKFVRGDVQVGFDLRYVIKIKEGELEVGPDNMLHIRNLGHDGLVGMSLLDVLRTALGLGLAAQRYSAIYFKNNARPNLVIELPGYLKGEQQIKQFRKSWGEIHQGVDNSHRPALLEGGAKISNFTVSNEDAQLLETMRWGLVQVANIVGIPPHFLGSQIATSHNSIEAENRNLLNYSLGGWLCNWKHECEAKLLSPIERQTDSHVIEQIRDELERADRKTEAEADVIELNNGIRTADEIRAKRNLPPYPDGAGSKFRLPLNIGTVGEEEMEEPEPAAEMPADSNGRADSHVVEQLLNGHARRLVNRVCTHMRRASKRPQEFLSELDKLESEHLPVFQDSFSALGQESAAQVSREWLVEVQQELLDASGKVGPAQLEETVTQLAGRWEVDGPAQITRGLLGAYHATAETE